MEYSKKKCCRLCQCTLNNEKYQVIEEILREVLVILFQKLKLDKRSKHMVCNDCLEKVSAAFNFKSICLDTDDAIFPYLNSDKVALVDLKEVYLKERKNKLISNKLDQRICRLCMNLVNHGFTPLRDVDSDMIHEFIPEMNFSATKDPIVCDDCFEALSSHYNFLKGCSTVDKEPTSLAADNDVVKRSRVKTEATEGNTGGLKRSKRKRRGEATMYHCKDCSFSTRSKSSFIYHARIHKEEWEIEMYHCAHCNFKTRHKHWLPKHELTHKDASERPAFKCESCSFQSVNRYSHKKHQLLHKDPSELHMYKCDLCEYQSKRKDALADHKLIHRDPNDIPILKCTLCDYKAKSRNTMRRHLVKHKDPSEIPVYKCENCSYQSLRKDTLRVHMLKHKNLCDVKQYKCDKCSYKSKYSTGLFYHRIKHMSDAEVVMYKCHECPRKFRYKSGIREHIFKHHMNSKAAKNGEKTV